MWTTSTGTKFKWFIYLLLAILLIYDILYHHVVMTANASSRTANQNSFPLVKGLDISNNGEIWTCRQFPSKTQYWMTYRSISNYWGISINFSSLIGRYDLLWLLRDPAQRWPSRISLSLLQPVEKISASSLAILPIFVPTIGVVFRSSCEPLTLPRRISAALQSNLMDLMGISCIIDVFILVLSELTIMIRLSTVKSTPPSEGLPKKRATKNKD